MAAQTGALAIDDRGRRSIRRRVWEALEGRSFGVFILTLISLNVVAVVVESVPSVRARWGYELFLFEWFSVAVFTIEYVGRLWACVEDPEYARPLSGRIRFALHPLAVIDLLAILPAFISLGTVDLRSLRALRLFRLVRIAKAARYVAALRVLRLVVVSKREELIVTTALMLILLVMASSVMYFAENEAQPDKFSSIPASMWWAVATLTTVGYGDIYPVTALGKLAGAVVAILGIGFFALPTAIIGSGFVEAMAEAKAPRACPQCGHALTE